MAKFNYSYDSQNDDLFMSRPNCKSAGSIEMGDVIMDFDHNGKLVALEFLHATKVLKSMIQNLKIKEAKEILNYLTEANVSYKQSPNNFQVWFKLDFLIPNNKITNNIESNINFPMRESPALLVVSD